MPKIIENVREQLLEEAKRQIAEYGYAKTTIRSVASACGLGIGTVYNYFPSKDQLIASFMAEDWLELLGEVKANQMSDEETVLHSIFCALTSFASKYSTLFRDQDAAKVFATVFVERHKQLRGQLSEIIRPLCEEKKMQNAGYVSEYIAESLLTWTIAGKGFAEQYEIIHRILKET